MSYFSVPGQSAHCAGLQAYTTLASACILRTRTLYCTSHAKHASHIPHTSVLYSETLTYKFDLFLEEAQKQIYSAYVLSFPPLKSTEMPRISSTIVSKKRLCLKNVYSKINNKSSVSETRLDYFSKQFRPNSYSSKQNEKTFLRIQR